MAKTITFDGMDFTLSDVYSGIEDFISVFGDQDKRLLTDKLDQVARYYRREFVLFTHLVNDLSKEEGIQPRKDLDKVFEILTRTPIIIQRRNSSSIVSTLTAIGIACMMIGKTDEFIDFAYNVLENDLYVSETSLEQHNGSNFYALKLFSLPNEVDPYKTNLSPKSVMSHVYIKMAEGIAERETTRFMLSLIKTDRLLAEQISCDIDLQCGIIYKTEKIKTITDLYNFIRSNKKMTHEDVFRAIFHNPCIYGNYGVFKYVASDADFINNLAHSDGTLMGLNFIRRVFVDEMEFYYRLNSNINMQNLEVSSNLYHSISGKDIEQAFVKLKSIPQTLLEHKAVRDANIPLECFVKYIDKLFVYNVSGSIRSHFESKYRLQDIVNLLH